MDCSKPFTILKKLQCVGKKNFKKLATNVLQIGDVADFETLNCL